MWRAVTAPIFESIPANGKILEGTASSFLIGAMMVGSSTFNQQQYRRDWRLIAQSGLDQYLVQLYLAGAAEGRCEDRPIHIRAGDIGIFDLSRPFSTAANPGATVFLVLPRGPLDRANKGKSLHGVVMTSERPLTRILADLIISTRKAAPELIDAEAIAVEQSLVNLLARGMTQYAYDTPTTGASAMPMLRQQMLEFIEANLFEHTLGPELLMQRYQISRASLYRIFADDGGIAGIIRVKRLGAAYRELAEGTRSPGRSITEIALRLGFSDSSQFTRAFHRRFAMTPTEARQEGARGSHLGSSMSGLQDHFSRYAVDDWLADLARTA